MATPTAAEVETIIREWLPPAFNKPDQRRPGVSSAWGTKSNIITAFGERLAALGLDDPTDAIKFYSRALDLRAQLGQIAAPAKLHPEDASTYRRREGNRLRAEIQKAYAGAVRAIHNFTEAAWLALLQPIAEGAFVDRDSEVWREVHALASFLRRKDVAGLSIAEGLTLDCYQFARPDLYHHWRLARAEQTSHAMLRRAGRYVFLSDRIVKGPRPGMKDIDPTWQPGLYAAGEAVQNIMHVANEQNRTYAEAQPAPSRVRFYP